jgi:hypothetical protein
VKKIQNHKESDKGQKDNVDTESDKGQQDKVDTFLLFSILLQSYIDNSS